MQNARSYFGRLSGLALFLLALLVVGLLIVFTIRSANDDSGTVATEDGAAATEESNDSELVAIPDLDSEPQVADDDATESPAETGESGRVASDEDGLPNTGPEEAVIPAAVIGLMVWQIINWRDSRRELAQAFNPADR
ncbi:MAG TPA: hypothetical protein VF996_02565 [Candidatus Saccharimonadales bacterium]|jgi:hypothetical protein